MLVKTLVAYANSDHVARLGAHQHGAWKQTQRATDTRALAHRVCRRAQHAPVAEESLAAFTRKTYSTSVLYCSIDVVLVTRNRCSVNSSVIAGE